MKFFVDYQKTDGTKVEGAIAMPLINALETKNEILNEHPDWLVEITPLEGTP